MDARAWAVGVALVLGGATAGHAQEAFDAQARPVLAKYCVECHGPKQAKGNLRLDTLAPTFLEAADRDRWIGVLERLRSGTMPPKGKPRPTPAELDGLTQTLAAGLEAAEKARAAEGRVVLRRLNRNEYENTIRDLLGVAVELKEALPADGSANGFDNVADALHTSPFLLEKYLEAADKALAVAIANLPQPPVVRKTYSLKETHQVKATTEKVFRLLDDGTVVCFSSSAWQSIVVSPFYPPDRGNYRFRITSSAFQSDGKPVTYRVDAGQMGMTGQRHLVGYYDAPAGKAGEITFVDHFEPRATIRISPYGLASAQTVHKIGAATYEGAGLAVHAVEVEGPLHDQWPPASHRRIFGDLPQKPAPLFNQSKRVEVASANPEADAERIVREFARRAFRRPPSDASLRPLLALVKARLAEGRSFEQAVRVGLLGVLVSPDFLFLREAPGPLDDTALASRLSYFLWSSMPDDELFALAEQKKLREPATLRAQVERMLRSPKASAFTENFVGQWLNLREIDATIPSHIHYPEYDDLLKHSMLRETYLFFEELLRGDLPTTNVVHADFVMLNGRLSKHYGIAGAEGWEFKKVKLPADSVRGGVLTMASVLKVTANGTYTSPILRGAFVLERILGTPPPRPPEGVTAVEPDIRGAVTIRQQLAKHRNDVACASCHAKIDPPGFALESFDVIGGWRDHYRVSGNGKPVFVDGRRMHYLQGPKVDPSAELDDGQAFADVVAYKKLLLRNPTPIVRNLAERLVTYSTGAAPRSSDRPALDALVHDLGPDPGVRSLVHAVVQSPLFRNK